MWMVKRVYRNDNIRDFYGVSAFYRATHDPIGLRVTLASVFVGAMSTDTETPVLEARRREAPAHGSQDAHRSR